MSRDFRDEHRGLVPDAVTGASIYRPLTRKELLACRAGNEKEGYLVARIVNRRDLERTLRTIDL